MKSARPRAVAQLRRRIRVNGARPVLRAEIERVLANFNAATGAQVRFCFDFPTSLAGHVNDYGDKEIK